MPQMDGLACLDRIMVEHPCPVVMVSSLTAEGADATLRGSAPGRDRLRRQAGRRDLAAYRRSGRRAGRQGARRRAAARIRSSARLKERVRHRIGGDAPAIRRAAAHGPAKRSRRLGRAVGEGLVLVGTSTGGPPALEALLTPLPADFPWPIVVAQHMPATFTGALARRLDGAVCAQRRRGRRDRSQLEPRLRLYRQGRCRHRGRPARRPASSPMPVRSARRLSVASKRRPARYDRHGSRLAGARSSAFS